jgi:3-deoxy-D-manno-octulosonic-acid transferase
MIYRLIYNLFFILALPFVVLKLFSRAKKNPDYKKRILERFGLSPFKLPQSIWIHSVSVGESIAIAPLVKKLIEENPNMPFVITAMTPTGSVEVQKLYQSYDNVHHCYLPYDLSLLMYLLIYRIKPIALIIMETELWPSLLHSCKAMKIPVILTNARLSERSAKGYQKISFIIKAMLHDIAYISAQTQADYDRFTALGMPKLKISVTGNLKYDIAITETQQKLGQHFKAGFGKRKIWIAASTHEGEDGIILKAHLALLKEYPETLLILVPRHPERFNQIYELALTYGLKTQKRSEFIEDDICLSANTQALIGDSMGEMMAYYYTSDIALVGGSLINHGGHNLLEPASLRKPTLTGPYTFNFEAVTKMLVENHATIIIHDERDLSQQLITLYSDPKTYQEMSDNAVKTVKSNQGALQKQQAIIQRFIKSKE